MDEDFETRGGGGLRSVLAGMLVVAGLGGAGYLFVQLTAPSYDPSELLNSGVDKEAEIISAKSTGREHEGQTVFELELQVNDPEGRGYRVFHQQPFPKARASSLTKTTRVSVKVDPAEARSLWITAILPDDAS